MENGTDRRPLVEATPRTPTTPAERAILRTGLRHHYYRDEPYPADPLLVDKLLNERDRLEAERDRLLGRVRLSDASGLAMRRVVEHLAFGIYGGEGEAREIATRALHDPITALPARAEEGGDAT